VRYEYLTKREVSQFERQRQEKLSRIRELGIDPYGGKYEGAEPAADIKGRFRDGDESQRAKCAGRIVLLRDIGKLIFLTLRDSSGTIQAGLSKSLLDAQWEFLKLLEIGDIIGASGKLGKTKTGEITIWAEEVVLLSKSVLPPPACGRRFALQAAIRGPVGEPRCDGAVQKTKLDSADYKGFSDGTWVR
jgi:lysyl-tRNA synthetase class 2